MGLMSFLSPETTLQLLVSYSKNFNLNAKHRISSKIVNIKIIFYYSLELIFPRYN